MSRMPLVLMPLLMIALGCLPGPRFRYPIPPGGALKQARTLALDPRQPRDSAGNRLHPVNAQECKELVAGELQAKGYRLVLTDQADLWVSIRALVPAWPAHPSPGPDLPCPCEGPLGSRDLTVVVSLVQPGGQRPVWLGILELPRAREDAEGRTGFDLEPCLRHLLEPLPARVRGACARLGWAAGPERGAAN